MTKDEAAAIITRAIAAEGPISGTLSIDAFAARLATALEALSLLDHCYDSQGGARPAPQQLDAEAFRAMQEGSSDVPPLSPDAREQLHTWAERRDRRDR